ncbi:hypothetical protein P7C70_g1269, partial [Phenoliferia sp. Uapishka_3]
MIVPIKCADCKEEFCAAHRWGKDHACPGKVAASAGAKTGATGMREKVISGSKAGEKAGLAALRRAQSLMAQAQASAKDKGKGEAAIGTKGNPLIIISDDEDDVQIIEPKKKEAGGGQSGKIGIAGIPIGKMDRRALAERASARKALEARAKKGLLSEDEKLRYATEKAREAREGNVKDQGCTLS